jgi:hypothetical protein
MKRKLLREVLPWILCLGLASALAVTYLGGKPKTESGPGQRPPEIPINLPSTEEITQSEVAGHAQRMISSLSSPEKLDALKGERAGNDRARKIAYWLERAKAEGADPRDIMDNVMKEIGWGGQLRGQLTAERMVSNWQRAKELGCLDDEGMSKLRNGKAPTIKKGPHAGTLLSVDHVIPVRAIPRLDTVLANLQFLPAQENLSKGSWIGVEEKRFAMALQKAGLITAEELETISKILQKGI